MEETNQPKKKILIVEDERPLLEALSTKFIDEGFEVLEARNGVEGLEMAFDRKPDLILLDIIMPIMDGMTMLENLRADKRGEGIKVILLTNLVDDRKLKDSLEEGAYEYLVKTDWKIDDVVQKVRECLGESDGV